VAIEIDVRFTDIGAGGWRILLERRHLDRYGDRTATCWSPSIHLTAGRRSSRRTPRTSRPSVSTATLESPGLAARRSLLSRAEAEASRTLLAHTADLLAADLILAAGPPVDPDDERLGGCLDLVGRSGRCAPHVRRGPCSPSRTAHRSGRDLDDPGGQPRFERVRVPRSMAEVED
jgi:hypothetical protein